VTQAWFAFETAAGRGKGHVRIKDGKIFTLFTALRELKGFEEKHNHTRELGTQFVAERGRRTWLEKSASERKRDPYCVIVGGGQGGLALGARLKQLGVPTVILDRYARSGDSWRERYKSLCLHDTVWYDHMPYVPFPDHWPVYSSKDQMGDWLESYAKLMDLDVWSSSECRAASYDNGAWNVTVDRNGERVTLRPQQLILATGIAGAPNVPAFPGAEQFEGVQMHSSKYRTGEGWSGRNCVVIGSNNSAHDVCTDLWEHGANVTMVQRSSTCVVRLTTFRELTKTGAYSEGADIAKADLMVASMPYRIFHEPHLKLVEKIRSMDAAFYASLEAVGFELDFGDDLSGIGLKFLRTGTGYYIDTGGSALIANREVALRHGDIAEIKQRSVVIDGTEVPADLIVYATGFRPMSSLIGELISPAVANKVGACWGLGSNTKHDPGPWEGEIRNMWKPTAQPALWLHGGNLALSRHYSLYLALQLKARFEGVATPVYR
jgi:putative flavoprotein involved in K+ transport